MDGPLKIGDNKFAALEGAEALMAYEAPAGSASIPTEAAAMIAQNDQVRGLGRLNARPACRTRTTSPSSSILCSQRSRS